MTRSGYPRPPSLHHARARRGAVLLFVFLLAAACGQAGAGDGEDPNGAAPPVDGNELPACPTGADGLAPLEIDGLSAAAGPQSGQVALTFRTPCDTAGSAAIGGFVVRAQVAHIPAEDAAGVPILKAVQRTRDPDGTERLLLSGLEPGRVLQFTVQAQRSGGLGLAAPAVAGRVAGRWSPMVPANAIRVSQTRELDREGGYYLLTSDVTAGGSAFRITARDVTFDLGGHTITYGADRDGAYGIYAEYLYNRGTMTVVNGTIRQAGNRTGCDAIHFRGGHDIRISRVAVTVQGPDCDGIDVWDGLTGDLRVDHCTIACNTTVVGNRHSPGVCALRVEGATQSAEIDSNLITASPQWGIKVSANETRGTLRIHHNRILGTRARVANGYMIGVHQPRADVFDNELTGESRGIHLDGVDAHGHAARIHDNVIRAQDQPNTEFPKHWCHGIKVEGPSSAQIYNNHVWVGADPKHSEARALDISLPGASDVTIRGNRFTGVSTTPDQAGLALGWTDGSASVAAARALVLEHNVFRATDRFIQRDWESRTGSTFRGNLWVRDLGQGSAHPFVFERFDNEEGVPSRGHRLVDCLTTEDPRRISQWANPGPYESDRVYTVRIDVRDAADGPVAGATVEFYDDRGARVLALSSDAAGLAVGEILVDRITPGPTVTSPSPFQVRVRKNGVGAYAASFDLVGRFALRVDLAAGTGAADTTPPPAPAAPRVHILSASRALIRWRAPEDASGIATYVVHLDGEPAAVCTETMCVLSGLVPGARHEVAVQAVDFAGRRSAIGAATSCTAAAEDRGP